MLFGDVELVASDDAARLAEAGLKIFRKGERQRFNQPCSCFDGKLCSIYAERPERCRTFECRMLQRVHSGEVAIPAALYSVGQARTVVDEVRELVRKMGNTDETVPLNRRYAAIAAQPLDLSVENDESLEVRSELMLAVSRLIHIIERDFLK